MKLKKCSNYFAFRKQPMLSFFLPMPFNAIIRDATPVQAQWASARIASHIIVLSLSASSAILLGLTHLPLELLKMPHIASVHGDAYCNPPPLADLGTVLRSEKGMLWTQNKGFGGGTCLSSTVTTFWAYRISGVLLFRVEQ